MEYTNSTSGAQALARQIRETHGSPRYLRTAEVAKLIRAQLKAAFSGVKFSVRSESFSGGSAIRVRWMDGPAEKAVEAVARAYEGARFDGMIDYAWSVSHWLLPDGTVQVAIDPGSAMTAGMHGPDASIKPHDDAELVCFGSLYISCRRDLSPAFMQTLVNRVCERWGVPTPEVRVSDYDGSGYLGYDRNLHVPNAGGLYLADLVWRESQEAAG